VLIWSARTFLIFFMFSLPFSLSLSLSLSLHSQTHLPTQPHTHNHRYISSKKVAKALEIAVKHDIKITDSVASRIILPKKKGDKAHNDRRIQQMHQVAKLTKKQGSYHLACKLYTQCGDKVKAMKALLKSGDTKKIIFFAGKCRTKSVFVLAANYLTTLDSAHADPKILKNIIKFYTKAKEWKGLANFYMSCAQVEIDEFRDYSKAMQAYREAEKFLEKSSSSNIESSLEMIRQHLFLIQRFVKAREVLESEDEDGDEEEAIRTLDQLLDHPEVESTLRAGDIYFVLVKHFAQSRKDMKRAMEFIEDMRDRNLDIAGFLDVVLIRKIYRANGKEWLEDGEASDDGEVDDDIEDEVDDDDDDEVPSGKESDGDDGYLAKFGTGRFGGK
jgi:intraflagellar transport protein 140